MRCAGAPPLQALFFTPQVASLLLSLQPNPQEETSLVDELAFLAHMLRTSAPGSPCQPANLVATLRQSREAIGLGLLESQGKEMSGVTGECSREPGEGDDIMRGVARDLAES